MPCYHPLKAFRVGVHSMSGKDKYKICSYNTHHVVQYSVDGAWIPVTEPFYGTSGIFRSDWIEIPCGKCIGCRLEYSRQWANRCMLELKYHKSSYFVTLTYDNDHVPKMLVEDYESSEINEVLTLRKRDFQLFMKRLRKNTGQDLRYFACGEYGTTTFRPHYHAIIFGLELDDLEEYSKQRGYSYYTSDKFTSYWENGFAVLGKVNWDTCAYTARYIMKKVDGEDKFLFDTLGVQPEFTLMSRRPGIAHQYLMDHPEIYDYDEINISTESGGRKFRPPRYFDRIFDVMDHDRLSELKEIRKASAREAEKLKLSRTQLDKLELLSVMERSKRSKIKSLERSL